MRPLILGTGPAALTAATFLCKAGLKPILFDSRPAPGWKLLVAGSSGLNVSYECPEDELPSHYNARQEEMAACLKRFPRAQWLKLLQDLGEEPYVGSSRRWFLRNKTAAQLLQSWTATLENAGAQFHFREELTQITAEPLTFHFKSGRKESAETALLALGGGSWEKEPPQWLEILKALNLDVKPLLPANAGFSLQNATPEFLARAEGKPIKGLVLSTRRGEKQGELMITKYGLEGTPVYAVGCPGPATFDLKPDLAFEKLAQRIAEGRGSVQQRVENSAKLSEGALLFLKEFAPPEAWATPATIAAAIKGLEVRLGPPRPLSESISARGGLSWDELDENLQLRKIPGLFAAGEMVDWDAPTGGFLIQGAVSMGFVAAAGMASLLKKA